MPKYKVEFLLSMAIEAESEDEAKDKFFDEYFDSEYSSFTWNDGYVSVSELEKK